jgi:hypothetical protein
VREDAVKELVLPAMLKAIAASRGAQKKVLFTNIPPATDNIAQAKPDYYYGAQPESSYRAKLLPRGKGAGWVGYSSPAAGLPWTVR